MCQDKIKNITLNNQTLTKYLLFLWGIILLSASNVVKSQDFTITASSGPNGFVSPPGAIGVPAQGTQTFSIVPDPGYEIEDVVIDGFSFGVITSYTFSDVRSNHTIRATFIAAPVTVYTITANAGANGSISPSGAVTVQEGNSQSFSISPDVGFEIADVLVDGFSVGAVNSYTFDNVIANHSINVSFRAIALPEYTITATAGGNGSISPSGAVTVQEGSSQGFTITPDTGFEISDVLVDGASQGALSNYTFSNVMADHSIEARFRSAPDPIDSLTNLIRVFNQFTPNGDGINDTWQITGLENVNDYEIQVFAKSGQLVFQSQDYSNPWDGTRQGSILAGGVYYYSIRLASRKKALSGYVVVVRQ